MGYKPNLTVEATSSLVEGNLTSGKGAMLR